MSDFTFSNDSEDFQSQQAYLLSPNFWWHVVTVLCPVPSTVLGLMNHCALQTVSELVLLAPLLLRLRRPGADATKLGPAVEEDNWSALENVNFRRFRENIEFHQDKRRWVCRSLSPCNRRSYVALKGHFSFWQETAVFDPDTPHTTCG